MNSGIYQKEHWCKNCEHDMDMHERHGRSYKYKCKTGKCDCKDFVMRHFVYVEWYLNDSEPRINRIFKTRHSSDDEQVELED